MNRTDLALEAQEELVRQGGDLRGIQTHQFTRRGIDITQVQVCSDEAARQLGKPQGLYTTLTLDMETQEPDDAAQVLADQLSSLLPPGPVLVVGLGNAAVTPDAIGPRTLDGLLVTRHLVHAFPEAFGTLRSCSALAPGVLASTGIESAQLVRSALQASGCACIIAIDALAASAHERLCCTIQLSDTGIAPGSGVGNHRSELTKRSLGVPVIALGVPTVIRADALCGCRKPTGLIVTPSDIDARIRQMSRILSAGLNRALFPQLSEMEIAKFTGGAS